jgi:CTP:molybdopterin cytidylyltransferase MocA
LPDEVRRLSAVVLAAGASSRLGSAKQLVAFRGAPLVRRAASAAIEAGASPVIVVLGAHAQEVAAALAGLPGVSTVVNGRWEDGLASSLATGVREATRLDASCDGVLIIAVDQPLIDGMALRSLLDAFGDDARLVAAEYAGTIGVPAVIGREHFDSLLELAGDAGAGRWLRARIGEVRRIPMPDAQVDVDGAADVARLAGLT